MYVTQAEENKNRAIASAVSMGILALLLLFLILFKIITPNPPFPEVVGGGGGLEINFGNYNEGTGNVEQNGIGEATSVITEQTPTPPTANSANDPTYTSETGEDVKVEDNKVKTNTDDPWVFKGKNHFKAISK